MPLLSGMRVQSHVIFLLLEERREKLLRRVGAVWEIVKNRVVTSSDDAGGQRLAKVIHESSRSSLQNLDASASYFFNQPAGLPYKIIHPINQYFAGQWATTTKLPVDGSLRDVNLSAILSTFAHDVPSKESRGGSQKHAEREDSGMGLEEQSSAFEEVQSIVDSVQVQTLCTEEILPATENGNSPVSAEWTGTSRQSKPVEIVEGLDVIADIHDAQVSNYLGLCALKLEREHGQEKKKMEMAVTPAVEFFESAAERDSASAAYNAGLCHEYAIGGVKRVQSVRAVVLYRQAAVAGHKAAQYNLGILLLRRAVAETSAYSPAKDLQEAAKWLNESALQGFLPAKKVVAVMNTYGLGSSLDTMQKGPSTLKIEDDLIDALKVIFSMSAGSVCDVEEDQLTAYVTAAKGGSRLAAYNAGVVCERSGDIGRAIYWYKMATHSADVDIRRDAHYNIGVLQRNTDAVDAVKHLKAASRLGDIEAHACLKEMGHLHKL
ncbi:hypothetical protein SpCBS45565_g04867 [Spizellomyces sp. 'palustris']|nr:hypothetical protein SpCBS45565_g04867 [Spizellomyces sp. 'palustris']